MRAEKKKTSKRARAEAKQWVLSTRERNVAMVIYHVAEFQAAPAIKFLQHTARRRFWPMKSEEELVRLVEDMLVEGDAPPLRACSTA